MGQGNFTLPGEAGYEELTLALAKKWGADVIRDSDGTRLSNTILESGYTIYSTICIIREHNEWAKKHLDKLQQTFLVTEPRVAQTTCLSIQIMKDFFSEQFRVNDSEEGFSFWQVYDRTIDEEIGRDQWSYDPSTQSVTICECIPWHKYTVSFLCYRMWEEISMYNHTTNHWTSEHLMQIDPRYPDAQQYLMEWLENWCQEHPDTDVVRFTSLFYNFAWIWGSSPQKQTIFSDWGSYDFSVSPRALFEFEKQYGYPLTAEDFVNQGKYQVTHMPPTKKKQDYMEFINDFVIRFGRKLVDLVHRYGKKAYVFYDDSWIGLEPYHKRFQEFGFDGLIKCVFSGFEARLCAGVDVPVHELRLHPYLFPVGLGGAPTFQEGGHPKEDARQYWNHVRRALLREPVQRIGLGGYLHLVVPCEEFCDYIEQLADEFREILHLHEQGHPYILPCKVAVLHRWGKLRSWTLSGHFHETYMHDLIHINESLSGLPVEVRFISFEDVKNGALDDVDVVINAGKGGDAWSGGDAWGDTKVIEALTAWTANGGVFLGVNEPSALDGQDTYFRMAHVLGIDLDLGARVCHGRWPFEVKEDHDLMPDKVQIRGKENLYLTDPDSIVYAKEDGIPSVVVHPFGKGYGIYLSGYTYSIENTRFLLNLLLKYTKTQADCLTDNAYTECAFYPEAESLVVINNSEQPQEANIHLKQKSYQVQLAPYETVIRKIEE